MSRIEKAKEMAARKAAILKCIPQSDGKAIGARAILDKLKKDHKMILSLEQLRRALDEFWNVGKVNYSGNTVSRVYWRPKAKKKAA